MKNVKDPLNYIGALFLILGILSIFNSLFINQYPGQVLWLCYASLIILGISIIKRNGRLLLSQLNILIIPLIVWTIDFLYQLITQRPFIGITTYMFTQGINLGKILSLQHVITIPLALFALSKIRNIKKGAWKISIIQITIFYALSYFLTNTENNINCVFRLCGQTTSMTIYPIIWFTIFIIMILSTENVLNRFFKKN